MDESVGQLWLDIAEKETQKGFFARLFSKKRKEK